MLSSRNSIAVAVRSRRPEQSALVALLLCCVLLLVAAGPARGASRLTSWPADWAGTSFCASYGVPYMGTTYGGVAACGDAYPNNYQGEISYSGVEFDSVGFQCVELAARYFYYLTGQIPPLVEDASDYAYYLGDDYGYNVYPAGLYGVTGAFAGSLTPGQVISMWSASDEVGHVAVVTGVNVTAGNGTVTVMDENASASGTDTITVTNGQMSYEGIYPDFQWTTNLPVGEVAVPGVPVSVAATGKFRSVLVSWTASASGGPAASYTATAEPGGRSCSVSASSCVITGLRDDAAYSVTVRAVNAAGLSPTSVPVSAVPVDANPDFTGSGYSDLAWLTGKASGDNTLWLFDGATGFGTVGDGTGFKIPEPGVAGDFSGNGKSEIAWFRPARAGALNGNIDLVSWNGRAWHTTIARRGIRRPVWVGAGDFSGTGHDDLAWLIRNSSGSYTLWLLNGARRFATIGKTSGYGIPEPGVVGDFTGNGRSEIAWFQPSHSGALTGTIYLVSWIRGAWRSALARGPGVGRPTWAGAGTFAGGSYDDLAWYTPSSSGPGTLWLFDGAHGFATLGQTTAFYPPVPGVVGDFTGSGQSEIAWFQLDGAGSPTGTIYVVSWNGSSWQVAPGRGPGVGRPDFVATTAASYTH
jgi:surface antigen